MTDTNIPDDDLLLAPPERQAQLEDMWQMLTAIGIASRHQELSSQRQSPPTPLTILSGFLGAGKTTLLNELLSGDHGQRLAVIVNDFGSVNIDAALIRSQDSGVISLANGCVCCSNSGQLGDTLDRLLTSDAPPDAIVLESSGVADPINTAHVVLVNPGIRLDAVVTLVDSETVLERLDDPTFGHLVKRQLEAADLVILNKVDLVSDEQMAGVTDWVAAHIPKATRIEAEHGRVPADVLLGAGLSHLAPELTTVGEPEKAHASFETWSFSTSNPLDRTVLTHLLSDLPESIVRAKGIIQLADEPNHQTIFQAVGRRWKLEIGEPWGDITPQTDLVLIGAASSIDTTVFELRLLKTTADTK